MPVDDGRRRSCRTYLAASMFAALALAMSVCAHAQTRAYAAGEPITAFCTTPCANDAFASSAFDPAPVGISVRVADYDTVTYRSADTTQVFTSKQRGTSYFTDGAGQHLRYTAEWVVITGSGALVPTSPGSLSATYAATLPTGVTEQQVTVRCIIHDMDPTASRRDPDKMITPDITFAVVSRPTIHVNVASVDANGNVVSGTPVSSGFGTAGVALRFSVTKRCGSTWNLGNGAISWTTPWGSSTQETFTTPSLSVDEVHRRFQFAAAATFWRQVYFPPWFMLQTSTDSKATSRILAFEMTSRDELSDTSRGRSGDPEFNPDGSIKSVTNNIVNPPNWFDSRANHWGNVVSRFNETDESLLPNLFVVYYAPRFRELAATDSGAVTDPSGLHAPDGLTYAEAYRGRMYLFPELLAYTDASQFQPDCMPHVGGIDAVAMAVYHEMAHRDQWLDPQNWAGFSNDQIGSKADGTYRPFNGNMAYDTDQDGVNDDFERAHRDDYHMLCGLGQDISILRWWRGGWVPGDPVVPDIEMLAQLWGTWPYAVGALELSDWSAAGRQDY